MEKCEIGNILDIILRNSRSIYLTLVGTFNAVYITFSMGRR